MAFAPDGTLWAGSYPHGLFAIDARTGTVRAHYGDAEFGNSWIFGVAVDTAGQVWVSTFAGLFRSAGQGSRLRFERQEPPGSESREGFRRCFVDHRGRVWAPGDRGLAHFDHGKWRRFALQDGLKHLRIETLTEAPDGTSWLA